MMTMTSKDGCGNSDFERFGGLPYAVPAGRDFSIGWLLLVRAFPATLFNPSQPSAAWDRSVEFPACSMSDGDYVSANPPTSFFGNAER
jgi:hypothetical protein